MKFIVILVTGVLLNFQAPAQTWDELFRQKRTQRKYLSKQIALLKLYLGYLKTGYEIADKGLTLINDIKHGDFNLHREYLGSLKNVNPHIANAAKVADILAFQVYILQGIRDVNNFCSTNAQFTPQEIRYVASVYANMVRLTDASIAELMIIIQANQTAMKDDERLKRIDKLYADMLKKYAFVRSFDNDVHLLAFTREREQREIEVLKNQFENI